MDDQLHKIAQDVASDIIGDNPDADVDYDVYIEELDGKLVGVIDMGDSFASAYVCDDGEWEQDFTYDPHDTISRILRKRTGGRMR